MMRSGSWVLVCLCLSYLDQTSGSLPDPKNAALWKHLMRNYDKKMIPIKKRTPASQTWINFDVSTSKENLDKIMSIAVGLSVTYISGLSETGVLTATALIKMSWVDYRLKWNPINYENISVVRADSGDIWRPDLEIYNTKDFRLMSLASQLESGRTKALIYSDGKVVFVPPVNLQVFCSHFSQSSWHKDYQECNVNIGSWTHDGNIMNLTFYEDKDRIDLDDLAPSSPWIVTKQLGNVRTSKQFPCCPDPYNYFSYRFLMKKRFILSGKPVSGIVYLILGVCAAILTLVIIFGATHLCVLCQQRTRGLKDEY